MISENAKSEQNSSSFWQNTLLKRMCPVAIEAPFAYLVVMVCIGGLLSY